MIDNLNRVMVLVTIFTSLSAMTAWAGSELSNGDNGSNEADAIMLKAPAGETVVAPKPAASAQPEEVEQVPVAEKKAPAVVVEKSSITTNVPLAAVKTPTRESRITSVRTDYDRKEGVILFDKNVHVDDEQYQMHTDRLYVFLKGTNDLDRLVAIGRVSVTNENRSAGCSRATYTKETSKIVMYGTPSEKAWIHDDSRNNSTLRGDIITFWLNSEQVEVIGSEVVLPPGTMKRSDARGLLGR